MQKYKAPHASIGLPFLGTLNISNYMPHPWKGPFLGHPVALLRSASVHVHGGKINPRDKLFGSAGCFSSTVIKRSGTTTRMKWENELRKAEDKMREERKKEEGSDRGSEAVNVTPCTQPSWTSNCLLCLQSPFALLLCLVLWPSDTAIRTQRRIGLVQPSVLCFVPHATMDAKEEKPHNQNKA